MQRKKIISYLRFELFEYFFLNIKEEEKEEVETCLKIVTTKIKLPRCGSSFVALLFVVFSFWVVVKGKLSSTVVAVVVVDGVGRRGVEEVLAF